MMGAKPPVALCYYPLLQLPGKRNPAEKLAWEKCQEIAKEVHGEDESKNLMPGVCNYFSGPRNVNLKWEENNYEIPEYPSFHFVKLDD